MTALAPYVVFSVLVLGMLIGAAVVVLAFLKPPTPRGAFRLKHLFQDRDLLEKTRTQLLIEGSVLLLSGIAVILLFLHIYLRKDHARPTRCSDYLLGPTTTSERLDPGLERSPSVQMADRAIGDTVEDCDPMLRCAPNGAAEPFRSQRS